MITFGTLEIYGGGGRPVHLTFVLLPPLVVPRWQFPPYPGDDSELSFALLIARIWLYIHCCVQLPCAGDDTQPCCISYHCC